MYANLYSTGSFSKVLLETISQKVSVELRLLCPMESGICEIHWRPLAPLTIVQLLARFHQPWPCPVPSWWRQGSAWCWPVGSGSSICLMSSSGGPLKESIAAPPLSVASLHQTAPIQQHGITTPSLPLIHSKSRYRYAPVSVILAVVIVAGSNRPAWGCLSVLHELIAPLPLTETSTHASILGPYWLLGLISAAGPSGLYANINANTQSWQSHSLHILSPPHPPYPPPLLPHPQCQPSAVFDKNIDWCSIVAGGPVWLAWSPSRQDACSSQRRGRGHRQRSRRSKRTMKSRTQTLHPLTILSSPFCTNTMGKDNK